MSLTASTKSALIGLTVEFSWARSEGAPGLGRLTPWSCVGEGGEVDAGDVYRDEPNDDGAGESVPGE